MANYVNFRSGGTIYWDQAVKYTNFINKVSKTELPQKSRANKILTQYMKESNGNFSWIIQGLYKGMKEGQISVENSMYLLKILSKKIFKSGKHKI